VPFWNICKRNVEFVLGREAVPGVDYAMTEVVHCKSRGEVGVAAARATCSEMWLERTLTVSPADVVVILGDQAWNTLDVAVAKQLTLWDATELEIGGRRRLLVYVRHPNFRGPRRWQDCLLPDALARIREALDVQDDAEGTADDRQREDAPSSIDSRTDSAAPF
jgi:hypothetical protein